MVYVSGFVASVTLHVLLLLLILCMSTRSWRAVRCCHLRSEIFFGTDKRKKRQKLRAGGCDTADSRTPSSLCKRFPERMGRAHMTLLVVPRRNSAAQKVHICSRMLYR